MHCSVFPSVTWQWGSQKSQMFSRDQTNAREMFAK